MKKKLLYLCCGVIAFLMLQGIYSCRKVNRAVYCENRLVRTDDDAKTETQYLMICLMGHDGANCPGCITLNDKRMHIDCQGEGSACRKASAVALSYDIDNNLIATTVDTFGLTDLDVLNMPSRSFALEIDEGVYSYLNIPAQLVYRDSVTLQFTFTGLSFTGRPLYGNN